jgi:choline dehydrogenase-like flavoprotein
MLTYDKPVKIYHNPMLFGCVLANQNVKRNLKHWLSQVASNHYDLKTDSSSVSNFRSANDYIKKKIFKDYWFAKNFFFKKIYSIFESRIFFINLYIENKYSNLAIQRNLNGYKIDLIENNINFVNKLLKKHFAKNIATLKKNKFISYFKYSSIPRIGHDNHYTGTIKINNDNTTLSVNEMCELNNFKNLYIVDGSVIPDNISFFPTGIIIANAHRIGSSL